LDLLANVNIDSYLSYIPVLEKLDSFLRSSDRKVSVLQIAERDLIFHAVTSFVSSEPAVVLSDNDSDLFLSIIIETIFSAMNSILDSPDFNDERDHVVHYFNLFLMLLQKLFSSELANAEEMNSSRALRASYLFDYSLGEYLSLSPLSDAAYQGILQSFPQLFPHIQSSLGSFVKSLKERKNYPLQLNQNSFAIVFETFTDLISFPSMKQCHTINSTSFTSSGFNLSLPFQENLLWIVIAFMNELKVSFQYQNNATYPPVNSSFHDLIHVQKKVNRFVELLLSKKNKFQFQQLEKEFRLLYDQKTSISNFFQFLRGSLLLNSSFSTLLKSNFYFLYLYINDDQMILSRKEEISWLQQSHINCEQFVRKIDYVTLWDLNDEGNHANRNPLHITEEDLLSIFMHYRPQDTDAPNRLKTDAEASPQINLRIRNNATVPVISSTSLIMDSLLEKEFLFDSTVGNIQKNGESSVNNNSSSIQTFPISMNMSMNNYSVDFSHLQRKFSSSRFTDPQDGSSTYDLNSSFVMNFLASQNSAPPNQLHVSIKRNEDEEAEKAVTKSKIRETVKIQESKIIEERETEKDHPRLIEKMKDNISDEAVPQFRLSSLLPQLQLNIPQDPVQLSTLSSSTAESSSVLPPIPTLHEFLALLLQVPELQCHLRVPLILLTENIPLHYRKILKRAGKSNFSSYFPSFAQYDETSKSTIKSIVFSLCLCYLYYHNIQLHESEEAFLDYFRETILPQYQKANTVEVEATAKTTRSTSKAKKASNKKAATEVERKREAEGDPFEDDSLLKRLFRYCLLIKLSITLVSDLKNQVTPLIDAIILLERKGQRLSRGGARSALREFIDLITKDIQKQFSS
jgi:hypothetical protein